MEQIINYTCCLCGRVYRSEREVVRCINRCGSKLQSLSGEIPIYEESKFSLCGERVDEEDFLNQMTNEIQTFRRAN